MRWTKKIILFIICGVLTFSVTSTAYYKCVHAMEWVGGALAFEEALKWLLAAIGITATAGMTDAYWDTYGDDFTDYAIENGATQTEVAEWQLKACQGIIDKGSVVWDKFKSWSFGLVNGSSSDVPILPYGASVSEVCTFFRENYNINISSNRNETCVAFGLVYYNNSPWNMVFIFTNGNYSLYTENNREFYIKKDSGVFSYTNYLFNGLGWSNSVTNSNLLGLGGSVYPQGYFSSNISNPLNIATNFVLYSDNNNIADDNFDSVTTNVNDLDVISSDGVDEDNPEVTIPMPGVSDSDNEASKDAYQDIIDAINDGTITQEQGVEQIQEILKIITYDTVTDKVVPPQVDPDTGEDKTKDDVLKENKDNMGFTLGGLEAVFPFCIPFDIYAFMTLLVAEPECPEFDFPIKSVNGQVEEIHVDLEPFEPVAVVVRYVFDFLFIIGLAMLTRSLIGGGSSD